MADDETSELRQLDKLCLRSLLLVEQLIAKKIALENEMTAGESYLIKNRAISSSSSSTTAIPTEKPFEAQVKSTRVATGFRFSPPSDLQALRKKIFGLLVSQPAKMAQTKFIDALATLEQCAAIQTELDSVLSQFQSLNEHSANRAVSIKQHT